MRILARPIHVGVPQGDVLEPVDLPVVEEILLAGELRDAVG